MDSTDLHLTLDYVGSAGVVLAIEQKASLQSSLTILKAEQKFASVYLWGRILGIKNDYFIAQGVGKDEISDRRALYSQDCIQWALLPPATKEVRERAHLATGRFTGDPSHEFEHIAIKKIPGEGDEMHEEEETITIKEEDRLAAVVAEIDQDVSLVPRGAFIRTPTGQVVKNRSFEGLSISESSKLSSYCHFREAQLLNQKPLLERASLDKAVDFLDTIDSDVPNGAWSLQFDRGTSLVLLKSLLWPGYVLYQVPGTRGFGALYAGIGEKNLDLPFML